MAVICCAKGHYYDNEKFSECPHCKQQAASPQKRILNDELTVLGLSGSSPEGEVNQKIQVNLGVSSFIEDEKTIGIFRREHGYEPVVGWLVCTEGKEKGRDFRLHAGRNFIGRSLKSDIALVDDERISKEDHCSVVYEPKQSIFMLMRGIGDGVSVEGQRLEESIPLQGREIIEMGSGTFVFVPFCGEERKW